MSTGAEISPGNVAVFHGNQPQVIDRRMRIVEMILRVLVCGFGVLAAALVGTNKQERVFFSLHKEAKFTTMKALVFLVIADAIAASYSLIQGLRCVVGMIRGSMLFNKILAWIIFSCDQIITYLTLAAVAATAQSAILGEFGQPELQWMKTCDLYRKFCNQVGGGLISSLVVSLGMVVISGMSAFNLFRLCGPNKGKYREGW